MSVFGIADFGFANVIVEGSIKRELDEKYVVVVIENSTQWVIVNKSNLFNSKAEAEAKLKELQGERE